MPPHHSQYPFPIPHRARLQTMRRPTGLQFISEDARNLKIQTVDWRIEPNRAIWYTPPLRSGAATANKTRPPTNDASPHVGCDLMPRTRATNKCQRLFDALNFAAGRGLPRQYPKYRPITPHTFFNLSRRCPFPKRALGRLREMRRPTGKQFDSDDAGPIGAPNPAEPHGTFFPNVLPTQPSKSPTAYERRFATPNAHLTFPIPTGTPQYPLICRADALLRRCGNWRACGRCVTQTDYNSIPKTPATIRATCPLGALNPTERCAPPQLSRHDPKYHRRNV